MITSKTATKYLELQIPVEKDKETSERLTWRRFHF